MRLNDTSYKLCELPVRIRQCISINLPFVSTNLIESEACLVVYLQQTIETYSGERVHTEAMMGLKCIIDGNVK